MIRVEVVACLGPRRWARVELQLPEGACVRDALAASGLLVAAPASTGGASSGAADAADAVVAVGEVGVWGRRRRMDDALRDGDRVECYRPLQCDPKESRRLRYRQQPRRRKPVVSGSPPR